MDAGRVKLGSDARIVLDAYPGTSIPAKVVFVASQAQFTPKTVETKDERDKLMFRVRVRIDPERLRASRRARPQRAAGPGLCAHRSARCRGRRSCKRARRHERAEHAGRARSTASRIVYGKIAALDDVSARSCRPAAWSG